MAVGLAVGEANTYLDTFDAKWVKLHTAEPGAAGATAAATETTRKQLSLAAASGGSASSDADLSWTSIAGSQDATHFSLWSASTAGTFLGSGEITANAYSAGNTFTIPSGSFTLTMPVAS